MTLTLFEFEISIFKLIKCIFNLSIFVFFKLTISFWYFFWIYRFFLSKSKHFVKRWKSSQFQHLISIITFFMICFCKFVYDLIYLKKILINDFVIRMTFLFENLISLLIFLLTTIWMTKRKLLNQTYVICKWFLYIFKKKIHYWRSLVLKRKWFCFSNFSFLFFSYNFSIDSSTKWIRHKNRRTFE